MTLDQVGKILLPVAVDINGVTQMLVAHIMVQLMMTTTMMMMKEKKLQSSLPLQPCAVIVQKVLWKVP